MKQQVIVTQLADRHKDEVEREFAQSYEYVVEAGTLDEVLFLLDTGLPLGEYHIIIGEPYA